MRRTNRPLVASAALAMLAVLAAAPAGAADTVVVDDEAAFLSSQPIVATESFDVAQSFPDTQRTVVFQQVRLTSTDAADPSWFVAGGVLGRQFRNGPDAHVDVVVDVGDEATTTAIGFRLTPAGTPNQFVVVVEDGAGEVSRTPLPGATVTTYAGISDPDGIVSIAITQRPDLADGVLTSFTLDEVSRAAVTPVGDVAESRVDCRHDGWRTLTRADGSGFRNQGRCIRYVNTGR